MLCTECRKKIATAAGLCTECRKTYQETILELMTAYNTKRRDWVDATGSTVGFDRWFTKQVLFSDGEGGARV
jgi:hypothetical protein